ncbi:MFS transporter, partial [Streptomyces sp. NPDC057543]|uniref:MFS transporter n=1 Tax=Streptomyces sp. NPDC057543 TaxID=3346163 RepID=UPI0036C2B83C
MGSASPRSCRPCSARTSFRRRRCRSRRRARRDKIRRLIAAYQLAATSALPLDGKLHDVLGTKKVLIGAVGTFLPGSALYGLVQSMGELIAARAPQGTGGGLMSVTMVALYELKGPDEDGGKGGSIGGIIAGAGMALGPWLGGLLAHAAPHVDGPA